MQSIFFPPLLQLYTEAEPLRMPQVSQDCILGVKLSHVKTFQQHTGSFRSDSAGYRFEYENEADKHAFDVRIAVELHQPSC